MLCPSLCTRSCGVACNQMLAKICSGGGGAALPLPLLEWCPLPCSWHADLHKPDGQYVLSSDRQAVIAFVETLPVRKVHMLPN